MKDLIVDAWTADVGHDFQAPAGFVDSVVSRVLASWEDGADVVLMPEFLWLSLERFVTGLPQLATLFWEEIFPSLQAKLAQPGKCVVLGTVPFQDGDVLRNRAVILVEGVLHFQDKMCLTPWEKDFRGGNGIGIWGFQGWRMGVLICLDVEIPDHSVTLRQRNLDLLLVPSATETILGTERIARCASARAVEIGCYVVVSHLVGKCESSLIDENLGRLSCYTPSQAAFRRGERVDEGAVHESGWEKRRFALGASALKRMRRNHVETNPSTVFPTFLS